MTKPTRNDRAILNAIREIRRRSLPVANEKEGRLLLRGISPLINRMEVSANHTNIIREWRKLCDEICPGGTFTWIDKAIDAQRKPK